MLQCELKLCRFCRKLILKKNHYYNHTMKTEFCIRAKKEKNSQTPCKICKKNIPETCLEVHEKSCHRTHECMNCGVFLTATSSNQLKVLIKKHICHSKLSKTFFTSLPPSSFKTHACRLKNVTYQNIFNRIAYFDIDRFVSFKLIYLFQKSLFSVSK